MMIENASEITILVSTVVLWLNLKQVTASFTYTQERVADFKALVLGETEKNSMFWPNLLFYLVMPAAFLGLLLQTELAEWVLLLCGVKFVLGAGLSLYFQHKILQTPVLTTPLFYLNKVDYALNILLFLFLPLGLVL